MVGQLNSEERLRWEGNSGSGREFQPSLLQQIVRQALAHFYDVPYLQARRFAPILREQTGLSGMTLGRAVQKRLLEAIEELRPETEAAIGDRALRRYELFRLSYVEGLDVRDVCKELGVSQTEFYRLRAEGMQSIIAGIAQQTEPASITATLPSPPSKTPNNLPSEPTPLIGREREVEAVRGTLLREEVRLVTLTGIGGTGKTRLGLRVAAELLDHFRHGVYFVNLAPLNDSNLVASTIARTLGLQEADEAPLLEALKALVQDKEVLILLDNFEHLLPPATLISELLEACPRLKVLVTSRARLHLASEHEFPVPPLAVPELTSPAPLKLLAGSPAVVLFTQRALTVRPGFALTNDNALAVAEICSRLDGLPLALELAAARVRILTPEALLGHLEHRLPLLTRGTQDLPQRQRTLRDTLAWSYDLLEPEQQRLFRLLGVFVGDCPQEAVEEVCTAFGTSRMVVLDGLEDLVDHSLMRLEQTENETWLLMLDTVREYARELLEESGELKSAQVEHAAHYLLLAEKAEPELRGPRQAEWLERLEREHDNMRAALRWSMATGETALGLRLAANLSWFWWLRGYLSEGRQWVEELLSVPEPVPPSIRAGALYAAGVLAYYQGDYGPSGTYLQQSTTLYEQIDDRLGRANVVNLLGNVAYREGDFARAAALHEENLRVYRAAENQPRIAATLNNLGTVRERQGDYVGAKTLYEESPAIKRELGDEVGAAGTMHNLGLLALYAGDYNNATSLLEGSLETMRQLANQTGISMNMLELGNVARQRGDESTAKEHYRASLTLLRELGDRQRIAQCMEGLAAVDGASGSADRAARLFGAADALRTAIGAPLPPARLEDYQRCLAAVREALGEDAYSTSWNKGRELTLAQAIAYALTE